MSVTELKAAEAPYKAQMLELLDELRKRVEQDQVIALVAIPIMPADQFDILSRGDIKSVALAGYLGRAWLDANELMKGEPKS